MENVWTDEFPYNSAKDIYQNSTWQSVYLVPLIFAMLKKVIDISNYKYPSKPIVEMTF